MLTDTYGLREAHRQVARRLAALGYVVFLPDLFYRVGRPPFFSNPIAFTDPDTLARAADLRAALTPDVIQRDAAGFADFVSAQPITAPGPLAIVGYCFSGAVALRIAAARPETFSAVASFHGGRLATEEPSSPHLLIPRLTARLYFGHASNDRSMPADSIARLERALEAWGGRYESEIYPAGHGWTVPDHPAFNKEQADRAFATLTEFLAARRHA
jgi:carboxymethylenebutenolidase